MLAKPRRIKESHRRRRRGASRVRFPGQYYDAETRLSNNVNRDYDSSTGRFSQADPTGFNGGVSLYAHGLNSPLTYGDPTGLSSLIFNPSIQTLTVVSGSGVALENFPAANNTQRNSIGPWQPGDYPYAYYNPHSGDGPDSAYGSNGINVFDKPGCSGCGVHSGRENVMDALGRKDVYHATLGCIRTTDNGTGFIRQLANAGDPLSGLMVTNNPPPTNLAPFDPSLPGAPSTYPPDPQL
ncbi:RHS repeat-associated core domain-containing protein [Dyella monticola]|uniref:RHS repeat-associated core domain-containing protein n=1 Tax=Dyella monticola TaxID=1927958 RepID=UPI003CCC8F3F